MVTGFCSARFLWSALKSCNHCAPVLCVFSSSYIVFQYRSVSAFGGSGLKAVLHWSWKYTLNGSLEKRAFIFFVSASLIYLLSLLANATSLCLAVSRASGHGSLLYFPSRLVLSFNSFLELANFSPCGLDLCFQSHLPEAVCAFLLYCVARHFQDYSGCSIYQFIGSGCNC